MTLTTAARLSRLLAILTWLAQVGESPIDEAAARFHLTPKTLVSELEMAACCGLPPYTPDQLMEIVVTETTVSARLGDLLSRPRRLTPHEGLALAVSARTLLAIPGSDEHGVLAGALQKLDRVLGERSLVIELDAPEMLESVRLALDDGVQLQIQYYSASSDQLTSRQIDPIRIFAQEGHWYVDAYCHRAEGLRCFRIDRIQRVEIGPPSEVSAELIAETVPGNVVPTADSRTVRLSFEISDSWMIDTIPGVGHAQAVGNRVEVDVHVGGDAWLVRLLLRLGPSVRVAAAPLSTEISSLVADAAARILSRYQSENT